MEAAAVGWELMPDGDTVEAANGKLRPEVRVVRRFLELLANALPLHAIAANSPCTAPSSTLGPGVVRACDYRVGMASPAASSPGSKPDAPTADPVAIRACLPPRLVAEFDAEWDNALEKAKASKDLAGVHALLHKWRHLAYAEMRDPGSYGRLLAKAAQILHTGENPTAGSLVDMQALIRERLGR